MSKKGNLIAGILAASSGLLGSQAAAELFINEFHYDNASTDTGEFIEVIGNAGTDLSGAAIVLYNGSNGSVYNTLPLSGILPDQCGGFGTAVINLPTNGLQNGAPDGLALVDPTGSVAEFLSYEGTMTATNGPASGLTSTNIGVAETSSTAIGESLQVKDGTWQAPAPNTFGTCNDVAPEPPTVTEVKIHEIQGNGAASPLINQTVAIEAIVTADFQLDGELDGFFVQEESIDQDNDLDTSEGLFVYCGACTTDVQVGDKVKLIGTVVEFNDLTELTNLTLVEVIASDEDLPPATFVSDLAEENLEALEGMRVSMVDLTVVANFQMEFGELRLSDRGILTQPTQTMLPGPDAEAQLAANAASIIILDDGSIARNPDPIVYAADGGPLSSSNTVRAGDTIASVDAVLSYGFGSYRLQPTSEVFISTENPRPSTAPVLSGEFNVASFNVLNYFVSLDERGADTAAELSRQREKLVTSLLELNADVVGLVEIENDLAGVDAATIDLVTELNTRAFSGTWDYVATGKIGTDQIKVAFIYRSDRVATVGNYAVLDASVDPDFDTDRNRPALAQTFSPLDSDEAVTVIVNHFKSKGSACSEDPNQNDGQGNCNGVRTLAANALTAWAESDPTNSGDPDYLLIGDFNAYAMEDPIRAIEAAGYTNLEATFEPGGYGYTFSGQRGTLDYGFASQCLNQQVVGAATWHINADEPTILDYNLDNGRDSTLFDGQIPFRTSDHDPLLMSFNLESAEFGRFFGPLAKGRAVKQRRFWVPLYFTVEGQSRWQRASRNAEVTIVNQATGAAHKIWVWNRRGFYSSYVPVYWLGKGEFEAQVTLDGCVTESLPFTVR